MAMSYEQFMQASGAELVCGNIIIGMMANRKKIGDNFDGVFNLNDEGQKMLVEIEANLKPGEDIIKIQPKGRKKVDKSEPEGSSNTVIDLGDNIVIPAITEEDLKV